MSKKLFAFGGVVFRGTWQTPIDKAGRFTLPLRFREALAPTDSDRMVITNFVVDGMRCLDVFPVDEWLRIEEEIRKKPKYERRIVMFQNFYLGGACDCLIDKRGRVLIPPPLREYAHLETNIILVSSREKFRVWDSGLWKNLLAQAETIVQTDPKFFDELGLVLPEWNREGKQIEIVPASAQVLDLLRDNLTNIYNLTAEEFEILICDRLDRMGFAPERVGTIYAPDGGVDILACPRTPTPLPYLLAVQTKHYRDPNRKIGPHAVKDLQAVVARQPFQAGLLVTNTTFTPDAIWFADNRPHIVRLRDIKDVERWIADNFLDEAEWRELPKDIELRPGVFVPIPGHPRARIRNK